MKPHLGIEIMPIYDFRCNTCRKRFEVFISYQDYGQVPVHCPHCKSDQVSRLINRVRIARSDDSILENFDDPSQLDDLEEDPRALGRMMRKMSREVGEDIGPEFNEVVDRLEKGQSPEEIEQSMPDLGADLGSDGDY